MTGGYGNNKYYLITYIMIRQIRISKICWLFPLLYSLMVCFTMSDSYEGSDFASQISMLQTYCESPELLVDEENGKLYYIVYEKIHSIYPISPKVYIASSAFVYFSILLLFLNLFARNDSSLKLSKRSLSYIAIFTCMCYTPIFISVSRYHMSVILVLLGVLIFFYKKHIISGLLCVLMCWIAYMMHEGILLIYIILLLAFMLHYLWFSWMHDVAVRNLFIFFASLAFLYLGPYIYRQFTIILTNYNLLSERYVESYVNIDAGDGSYLLVIVLCMLGPIVSLFLASFYNYRKNWVESICVSALFITCCIAPQKFFLVQRIFMFLPFFIGLSTVQIIGSYKSGLAKDFYILMLLLVPIIYACQLIIQKTVFWGELFPQL